MRMVLISVRFGMNKNPILLEEAIASPSRINPQGFIINFAEAKARPAPLQQPAPYSRPPQPAPFAAMRGAMWGMHTCRGQSAIIRCYG